MAKYTTAKYTLKQFNEKYPNDDMCLEFLKLKRLLIWLTVINTTDGLMTVYALNRGYRELNPLIAPVASHLWYVPVFKCVPTILVALLIYKVATKINAELRTPLVVGSGVAVIFMAACVMWNIFQLLK